MSFSKMFTRAPRLPVLVGPRKGKEEMREGKISAMESDESSEDATYEYRSKDVTQGSVNGRMRGQAKPSRRRMRRKQLSPVKEYSSKEMIRNTKEGRFKENQAENIGRNYDKMVDIEVDENDDFDFDETGERNSSIENLKFQQKFNSSPRSRPEDDIFKNQQIYQRAGRRQQRVQRRAEWPPREDYRSTRMAVSPRKVRNRENYMFEMQPQDNDEMLGSSNKISGRGSTRPRPSSAPRERMMVHDTGEFSNKEMDWSHMQSRALRSQGYPSNFYKEQRVRSNDIIDRQFEQRVDNDRMKKIGKASRPKMQKSMSLDVSAFSSNANYDYDDIAASADEMSRHPEPRFQPIRIPNMKLAGDRGLVDQYTAEATQLGSRRRQNLIREQYDPPGKKTSHQAFASHQDLEWNSEYCDDPGILDIPNLPPGYEDFCDIYYNEGFDTDGGLHAYGTGDLEDEDMWRKSTGLTDDHLPLHIDDEDNQNCDSFDSLDAEHEVEVVDASKQSRDFARYKENHDNSFKNEVNLRNVQMISQVKDGGLDRDLKQPLRVSNPQAVSESFKDTAEERKIHVKNQGMTNSSINTSQKGVRSSKDELSKGSNNMQRGYNQKFDRHNSQFMNHGFWYHFEPSAEEAPVRGSKQNQLINKAAKDGQSKASMNKTRNIKKQVDSGASGHSDENVAVYSNDKESVIKDKDNQLLESHEKKEVEASTLKGSDAHAEIGKTIYCLSQKQQEEFLKKQLLEWKKALDQESKGHLEHLLLGNDQLIKQSISAFVDASKEGIACTEKIPADGQCDDVTQKQNDCRSQSMQKSMPLGEASRFSTQSEACCLHCHKGCPNQFSASCQTQPDCVPEVTVHIQQLKKNKTILISSACKNTFSLETTKIEDSKIKNRNPTNKKTSSKVEAGTSIKTNSADSIRNDEENEKFSKSKAAGKRIKTDEARKLSSILEQFAGKNDQTSANTSTANLKNAGRKKGAIKMEAKEPAKKSSHRKKSGNAVKSSDKEPRSKNVSERLNGAEKPAKTLNISNGKSSTKSNNKKPSRGKESLKENAVCLKYEKNDDAFTAKSIIIKQEANISDEENKKKIISNLLRKKFTKKTALVSGANLKTELSPQSANVVKIEVKNKNGLVKKGNDVDKSRETGMKASYNKLDTDAISDEENKKSLIKGLLNKKLKNKEMKNRIDPCSDDKKKNDIVVLKTKLSQDGRKKKAEKKDTGCGGKKEKLNYKKTNYDPRCKDLSPRQDQKIIKKEEMENISDVETKSKLLSNLIRKKKQEREKRELIKEPKTVSPPKTRELDERENVGGLISNKRAKNGDSNHISSLEYKKKNDNKNKNGKKSSEIKVMERNKEGSKTKKDMNNNVAKYNVKKNMEKQGDSGDVIEDYALKKSLISRLIRQKFEAKAKHEIEKAKVAELRHKENAAIDSDSDDQLSSDCTRSGESDFDDYSDRTKSDYDSSCDSSNYEHSFEDHTSDCTDSCDSNEETDAETDSDRDFDQNQTSDASTEESTEESDNRSEESDSRSEEDDSSYEETDEETDESLNKVETGKRSEEHTDQSFTEDEEDYESEDISSDSS